MSPRVINILTETAELYPKHPAVISYERTISYADLLKETDNLIQRFSEAGLEEGTHLGLCLRNSWEFIAALFAASACGATVIPLGNNLGQGEFNALVRSLDIDFLVAYQEFNPEVEDFDNASMLMPGIVSKERKTRERQLHERFEDAAFIRPTSGTTGAAKGVVFRHKTIFDRVDNALKSLEIGPKDRVLWVLPMAYHFIVSIVLYVRAGACVVLPKELDAEGIIKAANDHATDILYAGPLNYLMLNEFQGRARLPKMRYCICTAGGVSSELCAQFEEKHKNKLRQVYGIIEAGLPIGNLKDNCAPPDSIGCVLQGFEVSVQDDDWKEVSENEPGELLLRGPGLFDGYYNPYLPRNSSDWFSTGDLVRFDSQGNFYIMGRKKSMLIVGGQKVFSEEVEQVLNTHPAVQISRVYGEAHELVGERVAAEVELKSGESITPEELTLFCKKKLSGFKVPQNITIVDRIRLTPTGKVLRHG